MDNYTKRNDESFLRRAPAILCERQGVSEMACEVTLSDYQPEIQRLLRVRATVLPPDTYLGAGSAEAFGTVEYSFLYCGTDGALYSAGHSAQYRATHPMEIPTDALTEEGISCDAACFAEEPVCRVTGPRRISVRCRLRSQMRLLGTRLPEEQIEGDDAGERERLSGMVECRRAFVGKSEAILLGDEILCDGDDGDLRVIEASGEVFVTDAEPSVGAVNCRGEVVLRLLCCHEASPTTVSVIGRKIPFQGSVPTDGAEVNCVGCAHGVCKNLRITVEDGRILCEVEILLGAIAQRNESVFYTKDLYSTASECTNVYKEHVFARADACINGNFSFGASFPLAELGIRPEQSVADVMASATVDAVEEEHGHRYLTGQCVCHLLLCENGEWSTAQVKAPFRYEAEAGEGCTGMEAWTDVISCRVRADGERLSLDAEIAIAAALWGENRFTALAKATFGESLTGADGRGYTVCYPAVGDTLWSVARRYHRPLEALLARNGIPGAPAADSPASLEGISYLLI